MTDSIAFVLRYPADHYLYDITPYDTKRFVKCIRPGVCETFPAKITILTFGISFRAE